MKIKPVLPRWINRQRPERPTAWARVSADKDEFGDDGDSK